jgi:C-terminal processing protease CtpA/Prc
MLDVVTRPPRPLALTGLVTLALAASAAIGQEPAEAQSQPADPYQEVVREMLESPAGLAFLDALIAVQREYLYGVDRDALFEGATAGLVEALGDPFSRYLDAEDAEAARQIGATSAVEVAKVGDIGVIRIGTFEGDVVGARFSIALDALLAGGARGLVLDLRGNSGGSILQGLQVLDRFLTEGELGYRRVRGVSVPIAYANPRAISNPLVVLVDRDTASTAEIVAGTLQAYGRARLIGTTTAGKGVGQTAVRLSDGSELRLVSFEWLLPGLRSIDSVGLTPDLLITYEPLDPVTDGDAAPLVSVGSEGGDPALRLALDALRGLLSDELASHTAIPVPSVAVGPMLLPDPDADDEATPLEVRPEEDEVRVDVDANEAPADPDDENHDDPRRPVHPRP